MAEQNNITIYDADAETVKEVSSAYATAAVDPASVFAYGSQVYQPRFSEPEKTNKNWVSKLFGGYNICIIPSAVKGFIFTPSNLPNCVGYAWGRCYELCKQWNCKPPTHRWGNPDPCWRKNPEKYAKGSVPRLGALIIWGKKGYTSKGHISVVEKIVYKSDGKSVDYIWISESGYPTATNKWGLPPKYTRWQKRKCYADKNYLYNSDFVLRGFLYPPYCAFFSKDAGAEYADGETNANAACGMQIMTVYVKDATTGQYVQQTGTSYSSEYSGLPDTDTVPEETQPAFVAGKKVQIIGPGNSSKLGTGKEVNCLNAIYQIKSIHKGFPYMYRVGNDKRGIGYFQEKDLKEVETV